MVSLLQEEAEEGAVGVRDEEMLVLAIGRIIEISWNWHYRAENQKAAEGVEILLRNLFDRIGREKSD